MAVGVGVCVQPPVGQGGVAVRVGVQLVPVQDVGVRVGVQLVLVQVEVGVGVDVQPLVGQVGVRVGVQLVLVQVEVGVGVRVQPLVGQVGVGVTVTVGHGGTTMIVPLIHVCKLQW